ncbi:alpha/beta fold hydrolase [Sphingomonas oligophenolica]|uniref:Alpha/beta hydrolase n=1 Tax=Sphingomonas oligophenolica TaxID=301154 RepID=A0A502CDT5_9SPHN|nr:alpha/beta hydrolase [Sphingomonas oligophenolica]TPG10973.1 alpha/beta hydrolase [Sphingomonas oligophenolica]
MTNRCAIRLAASILTAATIGYPFAAAAQAAPATRDAAIERLDHVSIARLGKGPPVVLIPGLSSPRAVWDGIAPGLAATHSVYLVELNGFGSGDPAHNLTPGIIDGVVADLDAYLAKRELTGVAVIGHSLGGLIGLKLAQAHPGDVGRLMVVDALPYVGDIFLPGATVAQLEPQAARLRDAMAASYGKPADAAAATATANGLALKPDSRAKLAAWMQAADPRVTGQALYEDMTTDLRPAISSIETPITLVYPWSAAMPKDRADAFYRGEYATTPHVAFVPVGDAAHFVMLDQPAAFAAAVTAFLAP